MSSVHEDDGVICIVVGQKVILGQPPFLHRGNRLCPHLATNRVKDEYVFLNVWVLGTLKDENLVLVEWSKDVGADEWRTHALR